MKEYIRDDGKIRNCSSNIAKMNIFEFWWFDIFYENALKYAVLDIAEQYWHGLKELLFAMLSTIFIILFPISYLIKSHNIIRKAKMEVEEYKKKFE